MQSVEVMAVRGFCIRRLVGLGQRASEAIERPAERTLGGRAACAATIHAKSAARPASAISLSAIARAAVTAASAAALPAIASAASDAVRSAVAFHASAAAL